MPVASLLAEVLHNYLQAGMYDNIMIILCMIHLYICASIKRGMHLCMWASEHNCLPSAYLYVQTY